MANSERNIEHPVNISKITDKIKTIYLAGKQNKQMQNYAVKYAKSALMYYWYLKPQTEDEYQLRKSEISRWGGAIEWHNAGTDDRLIIALSQDANHLIRDPERNQYEFGVALGNLAGLMTQQLSETSAQIKHPTPIMLR